FALLVGGSFAHKSGPGDVVIHGSGSILLRPDVKQDEISLTDWHRMIGAGLVVRVAAVGVYSNDRGIIGNQVLAAERFQEPLLNLVFLGPAVAHATPDFRKCSRSDGVDGVARLEMSFDLLV